MARLALKVTKGMAGVKVIVHYTKTKEGALRWKELSAKLKSLAPVPSIFIDERLEYEKTPQEEELKQRINLLLKAKEASCSKNPY